MTSRRLRVTLSIVGFSIMAALLSACGGSSGPENVYIADENDNGQTVTMGAGDALALQAQQQSRLQAALLRLPSQQRLLLRLRFEQDLTLAEVARLTRQPDPFRINRQIQAALAALAGLMEADESCRSAKRPLPSV